ncbi:phosphocholine cytidylyltransferase family protein [Candidatus Pelagibacter sp.]|nr:phosphocholine cytidylyltransferase family protein [Candidatus Pelagibacter sp.]
MLKVIIIAAGMGLRLRPHTQKLPKGLLNVGSTSIIQSHLDIYKSFKIKKINIVVGYKKEKFSFPDVQYFYNKDFRNNNILESLFYARSKINKECLISYSDIVFKRNIVERLINSKDDIAILTDINWKKIYNGRTMHPFSEAEKVSINKNGYLKNIGKNIDMKSANGEFIGMLKLSNKGSMIFKKYYDLAKKEFKNKVFFNSMNLKKAYIADFLNYLIKNNIQIKCIKIKNNWMEIDTPQDYSRAQKFFK